MSNRQGLTDAQVLAALYNYSRPQGLGMLNAVSGPMSVEEAQKVIDNYRQKAAAKLKQDRERLGREVIYVDYFQGRVIKVDIAQDPLDFTLYDRDLGRGAGDAALFAMLEYLTAPGGSR